MFTERDLLSLVNSIYAGILDEIAWQTALVELSKAFDGEAAAFSLHNSRSYAIVSSFHINIDKGYQRSYGELVGRRDMAGAFHLLAGSAAAGALTGDEIVAAARNYERSRFRDEWLRPQKLLGMIATPLVPTPTVVGGLFIGRPHGGCGFGADHVSALRMVNPHLLRACQARLRLEEAASAAAGALAVLDRIDQGVVLVDGLGTVVHANRSADRLLSRSDGLAAPRSVLTCDHPDDTATLRRLAGEASTRRAEHSGGSLAVRRRSGRRPLSVLVAPLRTGRRPPTEHGATAMVLVADPEATIPTSAGDCLRAAYGLTSAEVKTVATLLQHSHLADVSKSLGVSLSTVRTQLQRAFAKTGTHTQAELVHLMLAHRVPAA